MSRKTMGFYTGSVKFCKQLDNNDIGRALQNALAFVLKLFSGKSSFLWTCLLRQIRLEHFEILSSVAHSFYYGSTRLASA